MPDNHRCPRAGPTSGRNRQHRRQVSEHESAALQDRDRVPQHFSQAAGAAHRALNLVRDAAARPGFTWSQEVIHLINVTVMEGLPRDTHGDDRGPARMTCMGIFTGLSPLAVPALMDELVAWLRGTGQTPLVRSALLHLNIIALHPFKSVAASRAAVQTLRPDIAASFQLRWIQPGSAPALSRVPPRRRQPLLSTLDGHVAGCQRAPDTCRARQPRSAPSCDGVCVGSLRTLQLADSDATIFTSAWVSGQGNGVQSKCSEVARQGGGGPAGGLAV